MIVNEDSSVADTVLPLAEFKAHLRLGTGFGEDGLQDSVLLGFLRAAVAAIEARTGRALISRGFTWVSSDWRDPSGELFPVAPVTSVSEVVLTDAAGQETFVDAARYRIEPDAQRPRLRPVGSLLPLVPMSGSVRIRFIAGMAGDWGGLPADLGQAILLLAAHYYEYRSETNLDAGCMPFGVTSLIQRYRAMRISVGGVS